MTGLSRCGKRYDSLMAAKISAEARRLYPTCEGTWTDEP